MRLDEKNPPREFKVGIDQDIVIKDFGQLNLKPNEQVTFITENGGEVDFARKEWGFYGTPSMN